MQSTPGIESDRFTIVSLEEYKVDLEYTEEYAIIHLPFVASLTKEVYSDMKKNFEKICKFLSTTGYATVFAAIPEGDKTTNKLASRFGLTYLGASSGLHVYGKAI